MNTEKLIIENGVEPQIQIYRRKDGLRMIDMIFEEDDEYRRLQTTISKYQAQQIIDKLTTML